MKRFSVKEPCIERVNDVSLARDKIIVEKCISCTTSCEKEFRTKWFVFSSLLNTVCNSVSIECVRLLFCQRQVVVFVLLHIVFCEC